MESNRRPRTAANRPITRAARIAIPVLATAVAACKQAKRPYELHGAVPGEGPVTAIVNGTEIKGGSAGYKLPEGMGADAIDTLAFRYQTPCGAFDVPYELTQKLGSSAYAKPKSGAPRLARHPVLIDARGEPEHDVRVGKQTVLAGLPREFGNDPSYDPATMGVVFGPECGASHEVTFNGKVVGKIAGTPPPDYAFQRLDQDKLPIFITPRAACYRVRLLAVDVVDKKSGTTVGGNQAHEVTLRGPGAFYLPIQPVLYMKEPTKAFAPSGIYEVPCDGAP